MILIHNSNNRGNLLLSHKKIRKMLHHLGHRMQSIVSPLKRRKVTGDIAHLEVLKFFRILNGNTLYWSGFIVIGQGRRFKPLFLINGFVLIGLNIIRNLLELQREKDIK